MQERSEDIRQWWRAGLPIAIIAERLGLPAARVQRAIDGVLTPMDRAHRNRSIVMRTRTPRYTDQQLIDGIREVAARIERTPTQEEYRAHAHELGLASILTLGKRFGGWQAAVVAADLEPLAHGRGRGSRRVWDKDACWRALERVADQLGNPPRFQSYVDALDRPRRPALRADRAQPARPLDRHRDRAVSAAQRAAAALAPAD